MEPKIEKQIEYFLRLNDKVGLIEHCRGSEPNYIEGWCVDDNARAIQVCLRYKDLRLSQIKIVCFSFLESALKGDYFYNDLNQDLTWKEGFESGGEHFGRALTALGEVIKFDDELRNKAKVLFNKVYKLTNKNKNFWIRVLANVILGLQYYHQNEIGFWADIMVKKYYLEKSNDWLWFEPQITYDNGRIPMALLVAYKTTKKKKYLEIALESLDFLTKLIFNKEKDCFSFPGNKGWFTKSGNRAVFDQQPIEAGGMVEVYTLAYQITKNEKYKKLAKLAMDWYFGKNVLGLSMINQESGGIHDGLNEDGKVNPDQGAESVLSFLLAAKEIEKLNLT